MQILDATDRLFADHGFRRTSVRTIADLATVNLASVGYHFGRKADVLAANPDPAVSELVAAFAGPLFDEMAAGQEGGAQVSRLLAIIFGDFSKGMRSWTGPPEDASSFKHKMPS